jgi:hypothetical protein
MRLRLFLRRLTISAPRMAVRSVLPWPFRWAVLAIVLGFCAAIGLWAFEFGKNIAGLEQGNKDELARLSSDLNTIQVQLSNTKEDRDHAQSIANTANTLVTAAKASEERMLAQVKELDAENRRLKDDLGFFEKLIPVAGVDGIAIRGLQIDPQDGTKIKWQVLVMQAGKGVSEFSGRLELSFSGTINGTGWSATLPSGPVPIKVKQYGRLEGEFAIPALVVLNGATAKILEGAVVKATQSVKL